MKVTLLNYAQPTELYQEGTKKPVKDYEFLVRQAASVCVDKLDNPTEKGKMTALESGHLSILEHLPLTFLVEDVSRALTHQLVRHRIASYSQMSQRYAQVNTGSSWYVFPSTIKKAQVCIPTYDGILKDMAEEYQELMCRIAHLYHKMCEAGIPNEDARFILPNACHTSIIVSMNARAFVEAGQKRICNKAQWEIRDMFRQMRELIKDVYPTVYNMTKPNCQKGGCTEKKPCGKPYEG